MLAVVRVEKTENYTVMSNNHFREKDMSLRAKGLLSLMLSLPDNWDYSIKGLSAICKENPAAIRGALSELEKFGYLRRERKQGDHGRFEYEYTVYESPYTEKPYTVTPHTDEPHTVAPYTENRPQLNTNRLNTNKSNTKEVNNLSIYQEKPMDRLIDSATIADIKDQIDYKGLTDRFDTELLDTVVSCIADLYTATTAQEFNGRSYSAEFVQKRSMEINGLHIEYVLECFEEQREKVRNIRKYLETSIFNAPDTMGAYFTNKVRADGAVW